MASDLNSKTIEVIHDSEDGRGINCPATGACAINVRFSLVALALDRSVSLIFKENSPFFCKLHSLIPTVLAF